MSDPLRNEGIAQLSFTSGELSPSVYGHVDLARYYSGLRTCENFIVRQYGGVSNRPGTKFVADLTESCLLIPFQFSTLQTYILAFGAYTMRIFTNGGQVVYPVGHAQAGQPVVITTLYPAAVLTRLKYVQNADVMTMCHPDYPPQQLSRLDHHIWTFSSFNNIGGPFLDINIDTSKSVYASGVEGNVTLTATGNIFTPSMVGRLMYIEQSPDSATKRWEVLKPITIGDYRRAGGNYYKATSSATTGSVRPDHTEGVSCDGDPGVMWQYLHSGSGIVLITGYVSAMSLHATVINRLPDQVTTVSVIKLITNVTPGDGVSTNVIITIPSHGFTTGASVTVQGVTGTISVNGIWQISVLDGNTFETVGCVDDRAYLGGGTAVVGSSALATYKWALESWGGDAGYPGCTTYFQQRQCFAGSFNQPQSTWMSRTKGYLDFGTSNPMLADDGITFTVASREVNEIRHMIELSELILLTSSGEWVIRGTQDGGLSASSVNVKRQGYIGSSHITPIVIDSHALFVQEKGAQLRALGYSFQQDAFVGNDLTIFSSHLFLGHTLVDMAYQRVPHSCVWIVRDDGVLLGLTYMPNQEVIGWHRHTTDGLYKSVCCVSEGTEDAVYVVVQRTIQGATKYYIERMATRNVPSIEYSFFVDSGLSYLGAYQPFITVMSGSMARDIIMNFTRSRILGDGTVTVLFSTAYDFAYTGPMTGAVTGIVDYAAYRIDIYSTTDIDYFQVSTSLTMYGEWSVDSSHVGTKTVQLVRISDSVVVAEGYAGTGLVRSYDVPITDIAYPFLKDRCFLYDQALAIVMAGCLNNIDLAQTLLAGLMRSIDANGGEVCFSVNHKNGIAPDIYIRTGATAWVLYALAFFSYKFPGSVLKATCDAHIDTVAAKLMPYQVTTAGYQYGAFRGGKGKYSLPDYLTYDPNYLIGWCSTEHNIDCYFAFSLAADVRGNIAYRTTANQVKDALLSNFWSEANGRFCQGISNQTTKDYSDALDCHSWGYLFLKYIGANATMQTLCYDQIDLYKTTDKGISGYRPYIPDRGYPSTGTGVWGEGTLGVVLARFARGDTAEGIADFNNLVSVANGYGLQYSTLRDYVYELADWYSVASTAWIIIAAKPSGFWGVAGDYSTAIAPFGALIRVPASSISGLNHLEGERVAILADGEVHPSQVVTGGTVNLYHNSMIVHVGLPITADIETLDLATPTTAGNIRDKNKLINHVSLIVDESKDVLVGPDAEHLVQRTVVDTTGPASEMIDVRIQGTWDKTGRVLIRQDKPLPLTILAVIPEVSTGGS